MELGLIHSPHRYAVFKIKVSNVSYILATSYHGKGTIKYLNVNTWTIHILV